MEFQNELLKKFYGLYRGYIVGIIISFLAIITMTLLIIYYFKKGDKNSIRSLGIMAVISLVVFSWSVYKIIPYSKDLPNAKSNTFSYITGTVIGYNKRESLGDIAVTNKYSKPIILDEDGNEVILNVNGTELNKKYSFIYLEHSKLAVITKQH